MTAISKVLTGMIEGRMVGYHLAAILAGYLLDLAWVIRIRCRIRSGDRKSDCGWKNILRPAGKSMQRNGERRAGVLLCCLNCCL